MRKHFLFEVLLMECFISVWSYAFKKFPCAGRTMFFFINRRLGWMKKRIRQPLRELWWWCSKPKNLNYLFCLRLSLSKWGGVHPPSSSIPFVSHNIQPPLQQEYSCLVGLADPSNQWQKKITIPVSPPTCNFQCHSSETNLI